MVIASSLASVTICRSVDAIATTYGTDMDSWDVMCANGIWRNYR
jgi:hypothetical protein